MAGHRDHVRPTIAPAAAHRSEPWLPVAAFCLAAVLAAPGAGAVVQTSGTIEVDDSLDLSTIDIQYFELSGPVTDADFLVNVVAPDPADNIAAALFGLTGGGFGPLIDIESGAPGLDSFVLTNSLGTGSYAFVVGLFELEAGEFPPFQVDANTPAGVSSIEYEIGLTGFDAELRFTCRREGNLDGSQDFQEFVPGSFCPPPTAVDEPSLAALLLAGSAGLAGVLTAGRANRPGRDT